MKEAATLELIYSHLIQLGKTVAGLARDFENFTIITARNFTRLENRIDGLEEGVDNLAGGVDGLERRVHGTELGINRIERLHFKKLEGLEHDILDTRTKITRLSTNNN